MGGLPCCLNGGESLHQHLGVEVSGPGKANMFKVPDNIRF